MILKSGKTYQGRYRINNVLHEGAQAEIFLGDDLQLTRKIALKVLDLTRDPKAAEKFQQEAKVLAGLSHPNIVTVYSYGTLENGCSYISMEYVDGLTLRDWLEQKGKLSLDDFISAYGQLLRALVYLHENGIIHRNINPQNIMIRKENDEAEPVVKILDFGFAKDSPVQEDGSILAQAQTQAPTGNPTYMSPEQCSLKPIDARSDLFSLACVMYEAISGKPPFEAETVLEMTLKHANDIMNPLDGVHPDVIVYFRKALDRDITRRYQSSSEMLAALPVIDRLDSNKVYRMRAAKKGLKPWQKAVLALVLLGIVGLMGGFFSKKLNNVHIYKRDIQRLNDGATLLSQMDQNNNKEVYDTCKRILKLDPKTNKEARLTALRWLSKVSDSFEKNSALKYAQNLLSAVKADKNAGATALFDAYANLYQVQVRESKFSDAVSTAKAAITALKNSNAPVNLATIYQYKAASEFKLKRFSESKEDAEISNDYIMKTGIADKDKDSFVWTNTSTIVLGMAESGHDEGIEKLVSSVLAAHKSCPVMLCYQLLDAADNFARAHKFKSSAVLVSAVEKTVDSDSSADSSLRSDLYTTKSLVLFSQGKKAEAHDAATKAYNELKKQSNKEHLVNFQRFALLLGLEKDFALIEQVQKDIVAIAKVDDPKVDAGCLSALELGNLYKNTGKNENAEAYFNMALTYATNNRASNPSLYKKVVTEVAKFYDAVGKKPEAKNLRATITATATK